jgi:hypothetical protein
MARSFLVPILLILSLSACSSYHTEWTKAASSPMPGRVTGAWQGEWASARNGAHGRLWCIIEEHRCGVLDAHFKATWHGVFHSEHTAHLQLSHPASTKGGPFTGGATIHMFIGSGSYQCKGTVSPDRFSARYNAYYDEGSFELRRPRP